MYIKSIKVKNFKKFVDTELNFKNGLNIIYGKNESGKSTLMHVIYTLFAIDPSTRSKQVLDNINSWSTKQKPNIECFFDLRGNTYFLNKNFETKSVQLENLATKTTLAYNQQGVLDFIQEQFGPYALSLIEEVAHIDHKSVAQLKNIPTILEAIQTQGSTDTSGLSIHQTIESIKTEIAEIKKGSISLSKTPGRLKYFSDQKNIVISQLQTTQDSIKEQQAKTQAIQDLQTKLDQLYTQLHSEERKFKYLSTLSKHQTQLSSLSEKYDQISQKLTKLAEYKFELSQIEKLIDKYSHLDATELDTINQKVLQIEADIRIRTEAIERLDVLPSTNNSLPKISLLISIIAYTGAAGFVLAGLHWIALGVSILATLGLIQSIFILRNTTHNSHRQRQSDLEQVIAEDNTKLETIWNELGVSSRNEFAEIQQKIQTSLERQNTLKAQIQTITLQDTAENLRKTHITLETQIEKIKNEMESIPAYFAAITEPEAEGKKTQARIQKINQEILSSREKIASLRAMTSNIPQLESDLTRYRHQLREIEQEISTINRKVEILQLTHTYLTKVAQDTASLVETQLQKILAPLLPKITKGRYTQIRTTQEQKIEIWDTISGQWISNPSKTLSSGTNDLVIFLIKLAVLLSVQTLSPLPLLLDSALIMLDNDRKREALTALQNVAKNRQILYFSHIYNEFGSIDTILE